MSRFDKARASLEKRGLSSTEIELLFASMRLLQFHAGQTLLLREHTVKHFGIVLQGSVEQGYSRTKTSLPGDQHGTHNTLENCRPLPLSDLLLFIELFLAPLSAQHLLCLSSPESRHVCNNTSRMAPTGTAQVSPDRGRRSAWHLCPQGQPTVPQDPLLPLPTLVSVAGTKPDITYMTHAVPNI